MAQPLRILFIGRSGAEPVADELRRGGYDPSFEPVTTRPQLDKALGAAWDIAISDFTVGDFGALEALRVIQANGIDLPLIVVSGRIKQADILAALKAGAADHLTRGRLMRLNAAVERELRAAKLRRERSRLEEQFRQAQKMEAVGRLAGGVAHDFNNLLTVITGYSDLLLSGSDMSDPQRAALEEIRRSAERGGQLTHQLLAFSRRQPLDPRVVRVNEIILQMEKMLRRLIGEDIELITIPAASRDAVEADSSRLEQVIMNLVVNARDAMPDGGKLTLETGTVQLSDSFSAERVALMDSRDWRRWHIEFSHFTPPALQKNLAFRDRLRPIAERHDSTVASVAVAWVLSWPGVTGAIVGSRSPDQVDGWIGAAGFSLTDEDLDEIETALIELGVGEGPTRPPRAS